MPIGEQVNMMIAEWDYEHRVTIMLFISTSGKCAPSLFVMRDKILYARY